MNDKIQNLREVGEPLPITRLIELREQFLRFLSPRVSDTAIAEDILQSAYVKAVEHGAELRDQESVVAWFYRILRNAVIDHYRRTATQSKAFDQFAIGLPESYEPELEAQTCACIKGVVQDLKPEYRTAIEQVDLGGESVETFARSQNTTANNTSVRLHRARKATARRLIAVCGTCAEHKCVDCTCKAKVTVRVRHHNRQQH